MNITPTSERGSEDPSPTGPEGERVGDDDARDEGDDAPKKSNKELEPIPGPGAPLVPDHPTIDSNPIDPRVF
ncbi:MAG: hypothetical protein KIT84_24445 [Labilithrix sp.]|nr:hypothetical protein [Labilithrix sp.]MCW5814199.1 hypothetical protein [Labilithrix sp.]